ncbi:phosphotransferase [Streptomyces sp. Go-475]|uniref:phosphotransferase enzyme family protein n=1 Tax=Streptomyces sp. Go-475 TaxID=2072505 RepID=UPI000DEFA94F|nr:phosphotransferase [Streptomyces sp. Go-475]AXE89527.1 Phosphotransferase enzyme family protein [Streptomyces sp. Go-475]
MPDPARPDDTARSIAEAYALGAGPWTMAPVTRGALGQIWKLSGNGSSWAVKELLFGCDEAQVGREAALRDTAAALGIASPRLFRDRRGAPVCRPLPGGSWVKLYDWVDGTPADPSDPDVLDWFGRTTALLHQAGEGAAGTPSDWYERCPDDSDWEKLLQRVRDAGLPWADELDRFVAASAPRLARWVSPSPPGGLVTSHLDLQPQNVLVGPDGPVLLDWDNAGPVAAEREFARAVHVWSGGNEVNVDAARRLARAYREAGGPAVVTGPESFSMLFATALNYIQVQAETAVDPAVTAAQRAFAGDETVRCLRTVPDLAGVDLLVEALAG